MNTKALFAQLNNPYLALVLIPLGLIVSLLILKNRKKWLQLWIGFTALQATIWILKFIFKTIRPIGEHHLTNPSFPSGIAADCGFLAFYLSHLFPKYRYLFHAGGIILAFSRVYIGAHCPIDVVFGYMLGIGVAWGVLKSLK